MDISEKYPGAVQFRFGDNRALSDELLALVVAGQKTATCGALRDYENGEDMPVAGRRDIVTDWDGVPRVVIETVEVTHQRFCDVPENFALAEGEGDYNTWRDGHERFFARNGGFAPDMMLVCERFRVVEVLE